MYSVLIVDDERFTREGIARLTPWEEMGVTHVETAASGEEALEHVAGHMPHILLTDVEMDNMNGLELIRAVNELNPDLRIIVLTGHDDFAYVQECCRMVVHDYLLKPVEIEIISATVSKQVKKLEELEEERQQRRRAMRVEIIKEKIQKEKVFRKYLSGEEHLRDSVRTELYDHRWNEGLNLRVAVISQGTETGNEWDGQRDLQELSMNSVCYEMVEDAGHGIHFRNENDHIVLILFEGPGHPNAREILEQLQTVLQNEYTVAEEIYLGNEISRLEDLPQSYSDTMKLLNHQKRRSKVIFTLDPSEELPLETRIGFIIHEMEKNISQMKIVMELYEEFWQLLMNYETDHEQCRRFWTHTITDLYMAWLSEHKESVDQKFTDLLFLARQSSPEKLHSLGREFLSGLEDVAEEDDDDVIASVKRYIDSHLEENLSVTNLAGQFYLSVAYFSKLFKKTAGVGCNYYIMHQRMERAKILLRKSKIRVSDVAEQVGYQDVNYFSLTFKKYTGMAPVDYSTQEGGNG